VSENGSARAVKRWKQRYRVQSRSEHKTPGQEKRNDEKNYNRLAQSCPHHTTHTTTSSPTEAATTSLNREEPQQQHRNHRQTHHRYQKATHPSLCRESNSRPRDRLTSPKVAKSFRLTSVAVCHGLTSERYHCVAGSDCRYSKNESRLLPFWFGLHPPSQHVNERGPGFDAVIKTSEGVPYKKQEWCRRYSTTEPLVFLF
jgi:hypothetical protein